MPTFKLDGRDVPFEKGDTIIRAAHRMGIDIPHYCWHPGLSIAANCRMCLVEIAPPAGQRPLTLDILVWDQEKNDYVVTKKAKLQPACQQAVVENMEVKSVSSGRQLDHDYTLMTEYVCPVGALTSSDFRFKARVWFLRSARTVCTGCATGCSAYLDYDPRTMTPHRHRPRENMAVNQYWMCDEGMLSYSRVTEGRNLEAK